MQLLAEMDGFDKRGDVRIMAATNRVDMLDPALLRPGRFDRLIEIPLPDQKARLEILKIHAKGMHLSPDANLDAVATMTYTMSGAALQAICREAGMVALRRETDAVAMIDFIHAIQKVKNEKNADNRMYT
jgi:proteasome regulatory subunit